MSALPLVQPGVPDLVVGEMIRLANAGFTLVPLGGGSDGKSPLCAFTERIPLTRSLGLMRAYHSSMYGITLDGLLVADIDRMTPDVEDAVEAAFGEAAVTVASPRGRHLYFRHDGPRPDFKIPGVDLKMGATSYVAGPHSVRPDGGEYIPLRGSLGMTTLAVPKQRQKPRSVPEAEQVPQGGRHKFLVRQARDYAPVVLSLDELTENLLHDRDAHCEAGADPVPDAQVRAIAEWGWKLRTRGEIWEGRESVVKVRRDVMDALLSRSAEAFALYSVLAAAHGHVPGKRFAVNHKGMKGARLVTFSRERFDKARELLIAQGLLRKAGTYQPGKCVQQYQLGRLPLTPLTPGEEGL